MEENLQDHPMPDQATSNPSPQLMGNNNKMRRIWVFSLLGLVLAGGLFYSGYLFSQKQSLKKEKERVILVTPTQFPEATPTPKLEAGLQDWILKTTLTKDPKNIDNWLELFVQNKTTSEERYLGTVPRQESDSYEGKAVVTEDGGKVIYIGTTDDIFGYKIVVYSIPENRIAREITLEQIKDIFPSLNIPRNAALHALKLSLDSTRGALLYGYYLEMNSDKDLIIFNILTGKLETVGEKVSGFDWENENELRYILLDPSKPSSYEEGVFPTITKKFKVNI